MRVYRGTRRRPFTCRRADRPGREPVLAGRAANGAAIYVIPGKEAIVRHSRPDYVPETAQYVPWPHGVDLPPVAHRRRLPARTRTAILVLVGVMLGFLVLAVLAMSDPDPSEPPRPAPSVEPARTPPPPPDDTLAGDIVWGRR